METPVETCKIRPKTNPDMMPNVATWTVSGLYRRLVRASHMAKLPERVESLWYTS